MSNLPLLLVLFAVQILVASCQSALEPIPIDPLVVLKSKPAKEVMFVASPDHQRNPTGMTHYDVQLLDTTLAAIDASQDSQLMVQLVSLVGQQRYAWQANLLLYVLTNRNAVCLKAYAPSRHDEWLVEKQQEAAYYWKYYLEANLHPVERPKLILLDTSLSHRHWLVYQYEDGCLQVEVEKGGTIFRDSLNYDFFTEVTLAEGNRQMIHNRNGQGTRTNAHFFNDTTLVLSLTNWMHRVEYCYVRTTATGLLMTKVPVNRSTLPGILEEDQLIIPKNAEYLNDSTYVRYFYAYSFAHNALSKEHLVEEKKYSILDSKNHPLYYEYGDQSLLALLHHCKQHER